MVKALPNSHYLAEDIVILRRRKDDSYKTGELTEQFLEF